MTTYEAVFNVRSTEQRKASKAFVSQFGKAKFNSEIKPFLTRGLMSIFQNPPNDYTLNYVNTIAALVNSRAA